MFDYQQAFFVRLLNFVYFRTFSRFFRDFAVVFFYDFFYERVGFTVFVGFCGFFVFVFIVVSAVLWPFVQGWVVSLFGLLGRSWDLFLVQSTFYGVCTGGDLSCVYYSVLGVMDKSGALVKRFRCSDVEING